ncbi:MAG TPA: type II toxin-antitoxin system HicB family antitoxin [Thermomicrobiaceae bacterium]|nr:type II toxin-antitoxin system HicB family antitoxin [Thermomicrobiaceae bacterium]
MRRYTVLLTPDPDEGGYTVTVPALPGAITEGDTLAEALENARLVIAELLAVMEADGVAIPEEAVEPTLRVVEVA